jgi:hypothetical protein
VASRPFGVDGALMWLMLARCHRRDLQHGKISLSLLRLNLDAKAPKWLGAPPLKSLHSCIVSASSTAFVPFSSPADRHNADI